MAISGANFDSKTYEDFLSDAKKIAKVDQDTTITWFNNKPKIEKDSDVFSKKYLESRLKDIEINLYVNHSKTSVNWAHALSDIVTLIPEKKISENLELFKKVSEIFEHLFYRNIQRWGNERPAIEGKNQKKTKVYKQIYENYKAAKITMDNILKKGSQQPNSISKEVQWLADSATRGKQVIPESKRTPYHGNYYNHERLEILKSQEPLSNELLEKAARNIIEFQMLLVIFTFCKKYY